MPRIYTIFVDWETYQFEGIKVSEIKRWQKLYPDVNVIKEVTVLMPEWLERKAGTKVSKKKDWKTFIMKWLRKSQGKMEGVL